MAKNETKNGGNVLINYLQDSTQELKKVTWPTKIQAVKLTLIVLGFCLIVAIVIGFFDLVFNFGYFQLLQLSK